MIGARLYIKDAHNKNNRRRKENKAPAKAIRESQQQ
jgi:hypothetical protein